MSQAPVLESEYEGAAKAYADATVELNRRVDQGTSWSGNERNNLFLNLGNSAESKGIPNFVDASALTGFDFPDDSRGLASIDWDFDGDLDFITTNRSAPRVRILENQAGARSGSFVLLKLVGNGGVNRDAIGSRADLTLETEDGREALLVRSLHGGQGFISQSSTWLHFGIPKGAKIVRAEVRWPGGQREEFAGCEPGQYFLLNRGSGQARPWDAPVVRIPKVDAGPATPEEATVTAHLERRVPLPAIPYIALNEGKGEPREIGSTLVVELNGTDVPFPDGNAILNGVTLEALSASVPFQITSVTRDSAEVTLTWKSSPNGEYSVEYKSSLADADWQELDDGVPSEGGETSFTDDEPARVGAGVGWYRIRKN